MRCTQTGHSCQGLERQAIIQVSMDKVGHGLERRLQQTAAQARAETGGLGGFGIRKESNPIPAGPPAGAGRPAENTRGGNGIIEMAVLITVA